MQVYHHQIFVLTTFVYVCVVWTVSYEKLPSISVFSYILVYFLSFASLLITSFHVRPLWKLLLTSKVLHLLDQALSSILSRWSDHCSLFLSCKHFLILVSFSLILISFVEILSSGLVLHIHVTIFASFLSTLITYFSLTLQWIYFLLRVQAREGGIIHHPRLLSYHIWYEVEACNSNSPWQVMTFYDVILIT